jgi:hypothetical protein
MLRPRDVIIRLALEHFKRIHKLHLMETISHFLHNIFTIIAFLFNTFKILNVHKNEL